MGEWAAAWEREGRPMAPQSGDSTHACSGIADEQSKPKAACCPAQGSICHTLGIGGLPELLTLLTITASYAFQGQTAAGEQGLQGQASSVLLCHWTARGLPTQCVCWF